MEGDSERIKVKRFVLIRYNDQYIWDIPTNALSEPKEDLYVEVKSQDTLPGIWGQKWQNLWPNNYFHQWQVTRLDSERDVGSVFLNPPPPLSQLP